MNKDNKNKKRRIPESQEEAKKNKKRKTTQKIIKKVEEDSEDEIITEEYQKINNTNLNFSLNIWNGKKFQKLSQNLHGYMISYFSIEDMFKLIKLTRKFRTAILKINKTFLKFISLKKLHKSYLAPKFDILYKEGEVLQRLIESVNMEDMTETEKESMIQSFLCSINKSQHLNLINKTSKVIYYVKLIMTSLNSNVKSLDYYLSNYSTRNLDNLQKIAENIREIILKNKSMTCLNLSVNNAELFMPVFQSLEENRTLKEIDFSVSFSNEVHFKSLLPIFVNNLKRNESIEKIYLKINSEFRENSNDESLKEFILNNKRLKEFKIKDSFVNGWYSTILKAIQRNRSIEVVGFQGHFKRTELKLLAQTLYQPINPRPKDIFNNTIHTLDLSKIFIDHYNCCKYIGDIINNNRTIIKLNLSDNWLNNDKGDPFMTALKTNTSLKTLIMKNCKLSTDSFEKLLNSLLVNRTLIDVDVSMNSFVINSKPILDMLMVNNHLKFFNLHGNHIADEEIVIQILAKRILQN